jgi:hypothetical protein
VARILAALKTVPRCRARKIHGSVYTAGLPDIVGCYRGRYFGIECKQPGERPTALQVAELQAIRQAGGAAVWCDDYAAFQDWWHDFTKKEG